MDLMNILHEPFIIKYIYLMQKSAPPSQHYMEEDYFESAQKETAIQTVNFIPIKTFSNEMYKRQRKNEEELIWKLKEIQNPSSDTKKIYYKFSKNISFQDEEKISSSEDENSEQQQLQLSSFSHHYKQFEQIFHKRFNFGTSWIGRKQYLSSTFINPANIERANLQYYFETEPEFSAECSFDSNLQSGNLFSVFKINNNEYDLLLQNDFNTKGNTQWFYFRIINPPKNTNIKLNIVNMRKSDSLFNYGMMPCINSLQENRRSNKGWFRGGKQIKYFKNDHQIENSKRYYYTLTFTVSTPYDNDILKIAQSYPYTYTDLNIFLDGCEKIKYKNELIERETILNTVGKNKIEVLTIREANSKAKNRPLIFVMARQHPGQTPGSFICEGFIDFLLSKQKQSQFLRKNYEIKIIPMINPDGVCAGNYRTNLYGFDLNRRWDGAKLKNLHEAAYIKKYLSQITKGRDISFILDLHGHSRKMFSFFYGNPSSTNPIDVRMFPLLCSKLSPNYIKFEDCTFTSQQYKRNTARVQFGLSFKTLNIFTFEASFFGYFGKDKQRKHFTIGDYKQLGAVLGKAVYIHQKGKQLYDLNPDHKEIILYKKCLNELRNNMILISLGQKANSGSESSPQQCQLKQNQGQRLQENEDYSKDSRTPQKNIKIIKRIVKKQQIKWPAKSERQMQVMDIAQVNSIFPNNVLALIPSSFLSKKKKIETCNQSIQTDASPIIKIYETCKKQDNRFFYNPESSTIHPRSDVGSPQKKPSNLLKSNILHRARSESEDRDLISGAGLSRMSQRKSKHSTSITEKVTHKKAHSTYQSNLIKGLVNKEVQTILSFNCLSFGQMRSKLEKQISILELKTIDPSFTSFNYGKQKQATIIGKTSSINMLDNIKIRKRPNV